MKKLSLVLIALLVLVLGMSAVVAEEATLEGGTNIITDDPDHKVSYEDGKVKYTYKEGDTVTDVKFDDQYIDTVTGEGERTYTVDIDPSETHWVTVNGKDYWFDAQPTQAPVEPTVAPVEPTAEPVVTEEPDPTQRATRKPSTTTDDDDDDVPKTGDATIPSLVVLMAMAGAAAVLAVRKANRVR
jgi:LPXTG-motif cell wall-anchored protein